MGERTGNVMLSLGVVLWFASTWYFGWNWTAKSHAEEVCDTVSASPIYCSGSSYTPSGWRRG